MSKMSFNFSIDTSGIVNDVLEVTTDGYVLRDIHKLLAKMCEEYVPYNTGALSDRGTYYNKEGVHYGVSIPYAHYVYEGLVYGPNIPVFKDGVFQGFKSPENKSPTGDDLTFNQDWVADEQGGFKPVPRSSIVHPKATRHWDEVMMTEKGDEFVAKVEQIIKRRLSKLNG